MKFLLTAVNAKYIHSNPALYSLRAYAKEYEEHIEIAEYTINNQMGDILSSIYAKKPDVIGFSCYIWNITEILQVVQELHKIRPDLPIWLGGPEVSFDARQRLESYPELTGIMVGEGEETFKDLMGYYLQKESTHKSLEGIGGIVFRSETGEIVEHAVRPLTDISKLPFLYSDLDSFANKIIYYETSRGCPFRCSYCLSSIDKSVRLRDLDIVKKELQFFLDAKVDQVKFIDRTFNCNHTHAMEIWRYIKEYDNGITNFHFEIGADLLNDEEIALLNTLRPGAVQFEIGVQTTNEKTIHEIRRVMDIDHLEKIVERLHAGNNIHIHLDLIAGLPFEDYESFKNSFNRVYHMKPEQLQLGFLKVLKGSYMGEMVEDYGIAYTEQSPYEVLFTKWLSYEDVCKLKQVEEMVEIYYNSNQFVKTLQYLLTAFPSPFDFFETLAGYYQEHGLFVSTPSRVYRYQVLVEFVEELLAKDCDDCKLNLEVVKELLTYDIYLRENAKSRPAFAKDLAPYKESINGFFRLEEARREEGKAVLSGYQGYDARNMVRMTHVEPFFYDVTGEATYEALPKPNYVLFDYQKRNPLTYDCHVIEIGSYI